MRKYNFSYMAMGGTDKRPKYLNPSPRLERLSILQTETGLRGDDLLVEYEIRYSPDTRRQPAMYHFTKGGKLHPAYVLGVK